MLVEGGDGLVASMGPRLSRITARDLERMGVELHFGAMVTDMDDQCVVITKRDGSTERIEAATKVWAAGTHAVGLGPTLAEAGRREVDKGGRVKVQPDCSLPGTPRCSSWAT